MRMLIAGLLTLLMASGVHAEGLLENSTYKLEKTVYDLKRTRDNAAGFIAGRGSKFVVVDAGDESTYVVRFVKIYFDEKVHDEKKVKLDEEYRLGRTIGDVDVAKSTRLSLTGPVSGPLIVPFKWRTGADELSGEAAIGFYAGYRTEFRIPYTTTVIPLSPLIAGGLSQISVSSNGETESRTGITLAIGVLVQNWAGVNIGLVYGQDRIGDQDWEHEGDDWVSFMVGWDI